MLHDIPRRLTGHGLNRFLTSGLLLYGKEKNFHTSAIAMSNCFLQGFFFQTKVNLKDMKT